MRSLPTRSVVIHYMSPSQHTREQRNVTKGKQAQVVGPRSWFRVPVVLKMVIFWIRDLRVPIFGMLVKTSWDLRIGYLTSCLLMTSCGRPCVLNALAFEAVARRRAPSFPAKTGNYKNIVTTILGVSVCTRWEVGRGVCILQGFHHNSKMLQCSKAP